LLKFNLADDLSKILPVCEEKNHPLEKFNDFAFEDMWNFYLLKNFTKKNIYLKFNRK